MELDLEGRKLVAFAKLLVYLDHRLKRCNDKQAKRTVKTMFLLLDEMKTAYCKDVGIGTKNFDLFLARTLEDHGE